jgi:hypothetical protein
VRLLRIDPEATPRKVGASRRRGLSQWLVVADASSAAFSVPELDAKLNDLEWVSRAAVAHEAVVESFMTSSAVLPMKLFTLFTNDERALESLRSRHEAIASAVRRVADHDEWGVRAVLGGSRPGQPAARTRPSIQKKTSGAGYLRSKKALQDAHAEIARRGRRVARDLYDRLAAEASVGKRRSADELPIQEGPLLLDAAFLVPRRRAARFRALVRRAAESHRAEGCRVTLSGPWPPYSFVKD